VISVVILQNAMDLLNSELGSSNETRVTSTGDGKEVTGIEAERVSDILEVADQETVTIPAMKEPNVSCVPVVSVTFLIGCIQNCLPLYQCVLVKQKFDCGMGTACSRMFHPSKIIHSFHFYWCKM
jgi:hypothetical protein